MQNQVPWHSRFDILGVTFVVFLVGAFGSLPTIEGSGRDLDYWKNIVRFAKQFFSRLVLGQTLQGLFETVRIAMVSTH